MITEGHHNMGFSDMITLRTALPALVAALALAGCASTTPPVTRGAIEPATDPDVITRVVARVHEISAR